MLICRPPLKAALSLGWEVEPLPRVYGCAFWLLKTIPSYPTGFGSV